MARRLVAGAKAPAPKPPRAAQLQRGSIIPQLVAILILPTASVPPPTFDLRQSAATEPLCAADSSNDDDDGDNNNNKPRKTKRADRLPPTSSSSPAASSPATAAAAAYDVRRAIEPRALSSSNNSCLK